MKEAMFYSKLEGKKVKCALCNHRCTISAGKRGICGVRENREGVLYTLVYGRAVSVNIDPIEKKPLFNFYPGTTAYSLATVGCNFRCLHCQNWEISQAPKESSGDIIGRELMPDDIVREALEYGCKSIAYTYTEPTIFYEYAYDTAVLAQKKGIKNVFVTNGYITEEALREIAPYLDAANIDLKAFTNEFYKKVCGARLQPVLDNIKLYKELGIWVEVTTLLIPGHNDSKEELREIAEFIAEVGKEIPWHVTAFYPTYKLLDTPPTPVETLRMARKIGMEAGLKYVYEGNIPGEGGENTYCPKCGETLIRRFGFGILENKIKENKCPACGSEADGIGL
ncbi:pyruvate formate-lyase 1-activating enzyme [archaeon BMS3Abin16]|nr:pyruvate formate-lyase 1-activating enzyme [archaeon BMS3Abin16]